MARRVILDTGVLIAIERGRLDVDSALGADDAVIAAITATELLVGVERADDVHRQARAVRVEAILSSLPIEPYNVGVARVHARLAAEALAKGRKRSANDMMIAATAAATNRILLTTDASAGFDQLSGVRAEVLRLATAPTLDESVEQARSIAGRSSVGASDVLNAIAEMQPGQR